MRCNYLTLFIFLALFNLLSSCKKDNKSSFISEKSQTKKAPKGMVWVASKTFTQGAKKEDSLAMNREKPAHLVKVDGFFIDTHEVTNAQYLQFVKETGYITVAERPIDWNILKKQLPKDTPKPADSLLQPGSLTFNKTIKQVSSMHNYNQWWTWQIGANWKNPYGPNSNIEGKEDYPVVHIAYEDALAYCKWANRRLPTEAEWEAAAQGTHTNAIFTWGNNSAIVTENANTWQGNFPTLNNPEDGFKYIAPAGSYPPNSVGIYDMIGNVWEWTNDNYNPTYYHKLDTTKIINNPKGAQKAYNSQNLNISEKIIKGGSFLCHASYCASFRISARMAMRLDSGSDHIGFRTVVTPKMLESKK